MTHGNLVCILYIAIIYPLKPRVGRRTTLCIALGIWIGSIILSLPSFLYYTTDFIEYSDGKVRTVCYAEWPDGPNNYSRLELLYAATIDLEPKTGISSTTNQKSTIFEIGKLPNE
ncbi:hypothetical protein M8J77_013398 [Diaphorina citri]|nr:hypothetical protein M8J77_013398 [Diaphorina citri]